MKVTEKTIKKDERLQKFMADETTRLMKTKVELTTNPTKEEGTEKLMATIFGFERNQLTKYKRQENFKDCSTVKDIEVRLEASKQCRPMFNTLQ